MNREAIRARMINSVKKIEVEGWGEAYIRQWSGADRVVYMKSASKILKEGGEVDADQVANSQFLLVGMGLCDEQGNRLYNDDELQDLAKEISANVIEKLFEEISAFNGLELTEIKDEVKNSETTQKSDS